MKKFNFIGLLMAFVGVIAMTSCEHQYADYTPGAKENNQGVYFPSKIDFTVSAEDTFVEIPVARTNDADATEISYRVEADELFTYGRTVSFAAGATDAIIKIEFDGSALVVGQKYDIKIQLDPAEATAYAVSEYTFSVTLPEPWISLGQGIYFDDLLCYALQDPSQLQGVGTYVEFQQHAEETHRIRVVNPYGPETVAAMWGGLPSWMTFAEGTHYIEFDVTDPNNVKIAPNENVVELSDESGNVVAIAYMLGINMNSTYDLAFIWRFDYPIVLKDGIIKYPTEGLTFSAFQGGEYIGDFDYANQMGYLQYYLPGTSFVNYDMSVEYGGMKVEADNATTSVVLNFGFGGDVESFKFVLVDDVVSDATAVIEAIVAGSEEYTIYDGNTETFEYTVPVSGAGMKSVVAVPYAGGEAKTDYAVVYSFYFPGMGGGELPEVDIYVAVDSVVGITGNPDYEANYPSDSSMCIYMEANGNELKSIKALVSTGVPAEVTPEEVFASSDAEDFSDFISEMIENGYALAVYTGLTPGTTYNVFLAFTTIYGETKYYRTDYTPGAAAPETSAMRLNCGKKSTVNFAMANITFK